MFQFLPRSRQVFFWEPGNAGTTPEPAVDDGAYWAPTETQLAVYNLLVNDASMVTLLGGAGKVFDFVPQDVDFPFISLSVKPWVDRGNATYEGLECTMQINVWYQPGKAPFYGRGDYRVQQIQKRVDELLHRQALRVRGWNTLILRRALIDIVTDPDNVTRHGIQQFKLFLGK